MGLKVFTIDFAELAIDPKIGLKDYSSLYKNGIRLKRVLLNQNTQTDIKSGRTPSRFNEEYWNGENEFLTMSDIDTLTFSVNPECVDKITDYAIEEDRTLYQAKLNSLIISNAMTVGLSFIVDRPVFINQNVFEVNLDETKVNKKFILWYLNLVVRPLFQTTYTSKYLSKNELSRIKIPLIPKSEQDQIVAKIEPIEKRIKELKDKIKKPQEVINRVFAREFGLDLEKFEETKKQKFFEVDFSKISNYHSLRFDVKNQKYLDIYNEIIQNFGSSFSLKKISKDKGKYGANEPAKDGEKNIDTRYIRITDIDSIGKLIDDDWKTAEYIDEQYLLKDDDFLFARSGTVGKTFLYDSNIHEEAIFAGYFIKFELDFTNLNKLFFLYYTKSFIYDFWVNGIVRIKGQPNINANEYLELRIPNISLETQQKIVDEVKSELDKQEVIKREIESERNKIDEIIEKAIT